MTVKPEHLRYIVWFLIALLVVCDSYAIWIHPEFYSGDRVKEHILQISFFMMAFQFLLCAISFGGIFIYNRTTENIRVEAIPLLRKQAIIGIAVILLNAALFYIFIR